MRELKAFIVEPVSFDQLSDGTDNRVVTDGAIAIEAGEFIYLQHQETSQRILVQVLSEPCNYIGEFYMFWIERLIRHGDHIIPASKNDGEKRD